MRSTLAQPDNASAKKNGAAGKIARMVYPFVLTFKGVKDECEINI
ncbi:MAG TPA: hypothetical protein ACHBXZ_12860 [Arsenophonus nasoniae]